MGSWLSTPAGHGHDVSRLADAVELSARYVVAFVDEPCFDWWEERAGRHTVTLAAPRRRGLRAAGWDRRRRSRRTGIVPVGDRCDPPGRRSWWCLNAALGDDFFDASLVACAGPV